VQPAAVRDPPRRSPATATTQVPASGASSRPNALPLSKRGRQHQSIAPSRETSAALWQSPIRP